MGAREATGSHEGSGVQANRALEGTGVESSFFVVMIYQSRTYPALSGGD